MTNQHSRVVLCNFLLTHVVISICKNQAEVEKETGNSSFQSTNAARCCVIITSASVDEIETFGMLQRDPTRCH